MVKDIEKSKQFYHDLFGLDLLLDNDGNMILTEGLVLRDEKIWKNFFLGGGRYACQNRQNACPPDVPQKHRRTVFSMRRHFCNELFHLNCLLISSHGVNLLTIKGAVSPDAEIIFLTALKLLYRLLFNSTFPYGNFYRFTE